MKHYRRVFGREIDYTSSEYQPCWTCKHLFGNCVWIRDRKAVPGWIAEPIHIPSNKKYADSYKIKSCPNYERK